MWPHRTEGKALRKRRAALVMSASADETHVCAMSGDPAESIQCFQELFYSKAIK